MHEAAAVRAETRTTAYAAGGAAEFSTRCCEEPVGVALLAARGKLPTAEVFTCPRNRGNSSLRDSVRRALMNLTEAEREVVRLRFFEGLSYAEIADRRRCAVSTCKNQWASAQAKLKHCLADVYGRPPR